MGALGDVGVPRVSSANLRAAASFPKSTIELDTLFKSDSPNVGPSAASPYLFAWSAASHCSSFMMVPVIEPAAPSHMTPAKARVP